MEVQLAASVQINFAGATFEFDYDYENTWDDIVEVDKLDESMDD